MSHDPDCTCGISRGIENGHDNDCPRTPKPRRRQMTELEKLQSKLLIAVKTIELWKERAEYAADLLFIELNNKRGMTPGEVQVRIKALDKTRSVLLKEDPNAKRPSLVFQAPRRSRRR